MARVARGGWLSAVLGLSLLAVLAFLVGAFAGLVWKEPGLVAAYVRGDTTEIAWSTASEPVVAAAPAPTGTGEARPEPTSPEPETPAATQPAPAAAAPARPAPQKPPAVAAPPPAGHIAVQVGAFGARDAAESLRVRLEKAGFPAYLAPSAQAGDPWRVRVGPYPSRDEATRVARRLEQGQKLPIWVLDEDAE
jgi:cell division septation protein DedD